ncbi:hypothetical protein MHBO_004716 [Bonamia ostreae]|uniref:Serine-tRNA synthetase type1 N-terminal domain-containing protein n=1 Tax=Bonamia ostreae TaxID=126728 RepID=A0ABV2AUR0_9EUKA
MPLDIEMFRDVNGDSVKKLKESQRRRFKDEKEIDLIIQQDKICRESVRALDTKRRDFSALNKQIFASTKDKTATKKIEDERKKLKSLKMEIKQSETDLLAKIEKRTKMLNAIGNIVSDEVPVSNDEKDNLVIKSHGELKMPLPEDKMLHHHELLYRIGGYEPEKGAAVAGHRGYFLTVFHIF